MKKILYTAVLGTMLVLGAGCSKTKLDLYPYNQVATEQAFVDQQAVTFDVNGMYQGLRASGSYYVGGIWNILGDVLADNLVLSQAGRQSQKTYYQWTYNSTSTYGLFTGGYTITRRANAILENIGGFTPGTFKNDAMGQALAVRGLVYFDMARAYSKIYVNAADADYTLPYVTTTSATNMPASEPLKGFYDKVIADLVQAEGLISATGSGVTNIRMNKQAVAGLLARVYLYKGDYTNCIAAATRAIGATPTASTIPSIALFPGIWTDATASDGAVLFKVKNTSLDNLNTQGVNYYQAVTGGIKSEYVVDYTFNSLFQATDVRKSSYISTSAYNGVMQNHIIKYAGRAGTPAGVVDGKAIRVAEVLLARMEAEYRNGAATIPAAVADLILLKSNRYTGYVSTVDAALTGTALLNEILLQRRLELAFEGDRFWDLKRLNQPVVRDAVHGENADGSGTPPSSTIATLAVGDFKFNLPYPQGELTFNPAIKQNPGYN
ncbi:MAG: RagB/SusD family nutrient uptake outer membrane protein [Mucilaginibacter sp.]|uniref:RagB/SusD family nutrient uptake outer membrane protein n=1 Tax=Mucilaginibacter sp. TaxID=1882438 RepID=UPI003263A4D2